MPTNTSIPVIDLGYVKYAGYQNATAGINCCRGIPYVQPPLGDPRWRKPRPVEASNNSGGQTINATKIASACYQSLPLWSYLRPGSHNGSKFETTPQGQSEDRFVLDVLVPASPVSTPVPAMVQIYGGDYTEGNAALLVSRRCNGEWIKRESDLCLDPVPAVFVRVPRRQGHRPERSC
jgi:carboxylesterase type B